MTRHEKWKLINFRWTFGDVNGPPRHEKLNNIFISFAFPRRRCPQMMRKVCREIKCFNFSRREGVTRREKWKLKNSKLTFGDATVLHVAKNWITYLLVSTFPTFDLVMSSKIQLSMTLLWHTSQKVESNKYVIQLLLCGYVNGKWKI